MDDVWARIETRIRALGATGSFGPPANETSLLAAEAVFGATLPDDLRGSLALHNGDAMKKVGSDEWQSDGPFAHVEWLSLAAMLSEWQVWQDTIGAQGLEPEPEGPVRAMWWNPRWIPFSVIGGSTWHHCVDLDPAPGGRLGQVIEIADDTPARRVVARSFRTFLGQVAADLEAGRYVIDDEGKLVHESWR